MVEQRRIADGEYAVEFAAGGMQVESNPKVVACEGIEEELKFATSHVIPILIRKVVERWDPIGSLGRWRRSAGRDLRRRHGGGDDAGYVADRLLYRDQHRPGQSL